MELTLSTAASMGDAVTLTYTRGTNPIQDTSGNDASSQSAQPVQNHTGATNSQPVFASDTITLTVDENTASGMNVGSAVTATDTDSGDTLTHLFHPAGAAIFTVDADGQIKTFAPLDFESGTTSYTLPLYVRDNKGPAGGGDSVYDDSIKVTINVNNVNEPPSIGGLTTGQVFEGMATSEVITTYIVSDPENDPPTWSLAGNDAGDFNINSSTGALTFSAVPDYENPADQNGDNFYNVTVQATDGKNAQGGSDTTIDDTYAVTIEVATSTNRRTSPAQGMSHTSISKPEGTGPSDTHSRLTRRTTRRTTL